ncbi:MAG TPA: hypothetical protein VES40_05675, partial [Ilumatobacteraceae bacterium]|nr:hypothetical protein [Ilumatobacteraceae bacterium]
MRTPGAIAVLGALGLLAIAGLAACSSDDAGTKSARMLLALPDSQPGDVIALRAAGGGTVEWIDRRAGTIRAVAVADPVAIETLATIE